jgi:isocitrate dehydrogenase (NAD+)
MKHKATLILGDGIGPEVISATQKCIGATGVEIDWQEIEAGSKNIDKIIESVKKNRVALKGPIITPMGKGFRSINVALRQKLDLYACLRPCKLYPGINSPFKEVDLVIIRENSEDLYLGIEFEEGKKKTKELLDWIKKKTKKDVKPDSALGIKPISYSASKRIFNFAFKYAANNKRKKITCVHKANIMKFTDGLFLSAAREVAKKYSQIEFEEMVVDNMAMQLVRHPENFDILVLPNLYGDIISDLSAGLIGGLGVAPGANIGDKMAVFEPTHGAAPKYTGQNKVNPSAAILSGVMMLRYLREEEPARKLESAWQKIIKQGKFVTYDLKEDRDDPAAVGTQEMAEAIIKEL